MPRNASGTYTLPAGNPVVTATVISSTWANTTLDDLKAEVTDSLSRSAKGGMLGQLALVDGTAALPGLAFNSELSTGVYRPAANQLGLAVAGVSRVVASTTTPAFLLTSPLAAADAGTDFQLTCSTARTAGNILLITDSAGTLLRLDSGGNFFVGSAAAGSSAAVWGGSLGTDDLSLTLRSTHLAASGSSDVVVDTNFLTRTAGFLLNVRNNGVERFMVRHDGVTYWPNLADLRATAADAAMTLRGNRLAASATADLILTSSATRTAGSLLDVQNNGTSLLTVDFLGDLTFVGVGSTPRKIRATGADVNVEVSGNRAAASITTDVILRSTATRTAGNLLDVQNNAASRLAVQFDGDLDLTSGGTLTTVAQLAANAGVQLKGNRSAGDGQSEVVVNSSVARTAGLLLTVQNNGTTKFSLDFNGVGIFQSWVQTSAAETTTYTLGTGWTDAATPVLNRSAGLVHLNIIVNAGATSAFGSVLTLPAGWRPAKSLSFTGAVFDFSASLYYPARFLITTAGVLSMTHYDNGVNFVGPFVIGASDQIELSTTFSVHA